LSEQVKIAGFAACDEIERLRSELSEVRAALAELVRVDCMEQEYHALVKQHDIANLERCRKLRAECDAASAAGYAEARRLCPEGK
jgi:hypothetical protein